MKNRQVWKYRGCNILPQSGPPRYFGHSQWEPGSRFPQYYTQWWRIEFPDQTYCLCATKDDVREYVDRVGYRHGVTEALLPMVAA